MVETELVNLFPDGELPVDVAPQHAASAVLLRTGGEDLDGYRPEDLALAGPWIILAGQRYSLDDYDLVYTVADPYHAHVTDLVVVTRAPERLPGLARRIGHYGKYSWLLLPAGGGPVLKGNWDPPETPLTAELGD
jgi:hypothetical protein